MPDITTLGREPNTCRDGVLAAEIRIWPGRQRAAGKGGPRDAPRRDACPRGVQNRLADAVDREVALDFRVREAHQAERREAEPGGTQAEGLTDVSGLDERRAIRPCVRVPPDLPFEHRGE